MTIRNDYEEIGASIGKLIQEKQEAYGDSFNRSNEILRVLYPEGVTPDKYRDFLAVTRVIDKLFRIATDRDALGESPWRDVMGYALLSLAHQEDHELIERNIHPPIPVEYVEIKVDLSKEAELRADNEAYGRTPLQPKGGRQQRTYADHIAEVGQTTTVVDTEIPADHMKH